MPTARRPTELLPTWCSDDYGSISWGAHNGHPRTITVLSRLAAEPGVFALFGAAATAFMGNYPPRASSTTTRQMARLPVHPMFDDPLRWVVPRYNRPKPIAAPPTRYRPQDLYTRRLLETWRAMQRPQAVQTSPHPLEQALGYRPGGNYGIQPSVIASGNANGFVKNPPWWTQLLALAGGPMADAALGLARAAIGNRNAGTLSAIMGDYANQMSQFGDPRPDYEAGTWRSRQGPLGTGIRRLQQGNWLRGGASFGLNSPLKKASLTEFHATAKHIAAKAVSPSSETMRTI